MFGEDERTLPPWLRLKIGRWVVRLREEREFARQWMLSLYAGEQGACREPEIGGEIRGAQNRPPVAEQHLTFEGFAASGAHDE